MLTLQLKRLYNLFLILAIIALITGVFGCSGAGNVAEDICTTTGNICKYAYEICDNDPNASPSNQLIQIAISLRDLAGLSENPTFVTVCSVADKICYYAGIICEDATTLQELREVEAQLKQIANSN